MPLPPLPGPINAGPLGPPGPMNASPSGIQTVVPPPAAAVPAGPPFAGPGLPPPPPAELRRMLAAARLAKAQGMGPAASRLLAPRPGEHPIERDLRQRSNARLRWPASRP